MADNHIKIKMPQSPPYVGTVKPDAMIWVWDTDAGMLKRANINQLPFGLGGGGSGQPLVGSPFKVRLADDQVTITGGNTVVSDVRLAGKSDYPVNSSQLNNALFRDDELVYDSAIGSVTILNFELQPNEVLALYPDGVSGNGSGSGSLQPILDQLAELRAILAPFIPTATGANHARVWWTGTLEQLADMPGWVEDEPWRGRVPYHWNPAVTELDAPGKQGGDDSFQIKKTNLPDIILRIDVPKEATSTTDKGTGRFAGGSGNVEPFGMVPIYTERLGDGTAITFRPKYRVGMWIKYVGV